MAEPTDPEIAAQEAVVRARWADDARALGRATVAFTDAQVYVEAYHDLTGNWPAAPAPAAEHRDIYLSADGSEVVDEQDDPVTLPGTSGGNVDGGSL